jgi:hypothetical protein
MFAVTEGTRRIGGTEIPTYTREIVSANVLEAEAGTNGYQGGDTGHGSRTYFRISDEGGTDIRVRPLGAAETRLRSHARRRCELETIITALNSSPRYWRRREGVRDRCLRCTADMSNPAMLLSPQNRSHGQESLRAAVCRYVCAEYKNSYRRATIFSAGLPPVDCDNDHSENPAIGFARRCRRRVSGCRLRGPLQPLPHAREKREARAAEVPFSFPDYAHHGRGCLQRYEVAGKHHLSVF